MDQVQDSFFGQLKQRRRRLIKQTGKTFIRSMSEFLGRQSLVPDTPVLDPSQFAFTKTLEANWETIRDEARGILKHRDSIPSFDQVSPDQKRISKGGSWRTFFLIGFGERLSKNCAQAPETTKLLEQIPGIQTAWFSILAPGYHIPAHRGVTRRHQGHSHLPSRADHPQERRAVPDPRGRRDPGLAARQDPDVLRRL